MVVALIMMMASIKFRTFFRKLLLARFRLVSFVSYRCRGNNNLLLKSPFRKISHSETRPSLEKDKSGDR